MEIMKQETTWATTTEMLAAATKKQLYISASDSTVDTFFNFSHSKCTGCLSADTKRLWLYFKWWRETIFIWPWRFKKDSTVWSVWQDWLYATRLPTVTKGLLLKIGINKVYLSNVVFKSLKTMEHGLTMHVFTRTKVCNLVSMWMLLNPPRIVITAIELNIWGEKTCFDWCPFLREVCGSLEVSSEIQTSVSLSQ